MPLLVASVGVLLVAGCTAPPPPQPTPTPTPTAIAAPTVPIVDGGKRDGANGSTVRRGGEITGYVVSAGDGAYAIIDRFGLDLLAQLITEEGREVRTDTVIFAGETLTFTPNQQLVGTIRVVDGGPINGAMGTTTTDAAGNPVTYTVVEGDSADLIRKRFDIWWDQLANDDGVRLDRAPTLFVGQVLTFTGSRVAFQEERP